MSPKNGITRRSCTPVLGAYRANIDNFLSMCAQASHQVGWEHMPLVRWTLVRRWATRKGAVDAHCPEGATFSRQQSAKKRRRFLSAFHPDLRATVAFE
jgi:hypothetical protein